MNQDILPLFRIRVGPPHTPLEFAGTGFLVASKLLLTCWHCVRDKLADDEAYAAALWTGSAYRVERLTNVGQTATGHDVALATVDLEPQAGLRLIHQAPAAGNDVWTYGYPYTAVSEREGGGLKFELQGRFLQGYITRSFLYDQPHFQRTPSFELDMPAPAGLSGAPLVKVKTLDIVGMVYSTNDVELIEEFAARDPETGEETPEKVRIQSFGLAHHTSVLGGATGPASSDRRLSELLDEQASGEGDGEQS